MLEKAGTPEKKSIFFIIISYFLYIIFSINSDINVILRGGRGERN